MVLCLKLLVLSVFGYCFSYFSHCLSYTCLPGRGEILVRSARGSDGSSTIKNGSFHSPDWPHRYELDRRCIYRFVASVGEKVHIRFNRFQILGDMPRCAEDFLDVYIDVASSSLDVDRENARIAHLASGEPQTTTPFSAAVYSSVLDRSALLGRYCGLVLSQRPVQFVSLHREIVLDFFSNSSARHLGHGDRKYGFSGSFEFASDAEFYPGRVLSSLELGLHRERPVTPACLFQLSGVATETTSQSDGTETNDLHGVHGQLISPTYPGFHPDGLFCAYQLVGLPTQRINVDILDLDLTEQSEACPHDYLLFYDGLKPGPLSETIGNRICGQEKRLRIVSSGSALLILFVTGGLFADSRLTGDAVITGYHRTTRRGFRMSYTFSESLLAISIPYKKLHVRGTECDYCIRSQRTVDAEFEFPTRMTGKVLAPNRVCSIYFMGSYGSHRLESVKIDFTELRLPKPSIGSSTCDTGFLAVYGIRDLDGIYLSAEPTAPIFENHLDSEIRPDHVWCNYTDGSATIPSINRSLDDAVLTSRHSFLAIRLNATGARRPGLNVNFRLRYRFEYGFGIPGYPVRRDACQFVYSIVDDKTDQPKRNGHHGWTNSPNHPGAYWSNMNCLYFFVPRPDMPLVRISYGKFSIQPTERRLGESLMKTDEQKFCDQDFLDLATVRTTSSSATIVERLADLTTELVHAPRDHQHWLHQWEKAEVELRRRNPSEELMIRPLGIYCGSSIPGPVWSELNDTALVVRFHSDQSLTSIGFTLHYEFFGESEIRPMAFKEHHTDFFGNLTIVGPGGTIETPSYPKAYPSGTHWVWHLKGATQAGQILIHFEQFSLDGSVDDCSRAIVRVYEENLYYPLFEWCADQLRPMEFKLSKPTAAIRFVTKENRIAATGFRLVWTELLAVNEDGSCSAFRCEHTGYCISFALTCDGQNNCGFYPEDDKILLDSSDEERNCYKSVTYNFFHIGIGVSLTILSLFGLGVVIYIRERNRRKSTPLDLLSEISGSKHSVFSSQTGGKLSQSQANNKPMKKARPHSGTQHRPHMRISLTDKSVIGVSPVRNESSGLNQNKARRRSQEDLKPSLKSHNNLDRVHRRDAKYQSGTPYTRSAASHRKTQRPACTHSLHRNGVCQPGVSIGTAPIGGFTFAESDGGLLIRERMQKISIV